MYKTKRVNIKHFHSISNKEFDNYLSYLQRDHSGFINNSHKVVLKIDGLNGKFGKDEHGSIFFESAKSGPVFRVGEFEKYTKMKPECTEKSIFRAKQYDNILSSLKYGKLHHIVSVLPNNTKVDCEILFNSLKTDETDTHIKFVHTFYKKSILGTYITILPYQIFPENESLFKKLLSLSNSETRIINPIMSIIFNIDINHEIKEWDLKEKEKCWEIKNKIGAKILEHLKEFSYMLGEEREGIVIHLPILNKPYKIIDSRFAERMKLDNIQKAGKEVYGFITRAQPFHIGHYFIINQLLETNVPVFVFIVNNNKICERNPFNFEYRKRLVELVYSDRVSVIELSTGNIQHIKDKLNENGFVLTKLYCGEDRIYSYKKYINNIEFIETPRYTSATLIRESLKNNNNKKFIELMPKELHAEYEVMKQLIKESNK